nr:MAG TPA: hypothetical protein [Caudoviricetes sp.]
MNCFREIRASRCCFKKYVLPLAVGIRQLTTAEWRSSSFCTLRLTSISSSDINKSVTTSAYLPYRSLKTENGTSGISGVRS